MGKARRTFCCLRGVWMYLALEAVSGSFLLELRDAVQGGDWTVRNLASALFPCDASSLVLLLGCAALSISAWERRERIWEWVFSGLCAAAWLLGKSYLETDSWALLFGRAASRAASAFIFVGLTMLLHTALGCARIGLGKLLRMNPKLPEWAVKHEFLAAWGVMTALYVPFVVIRYPAGIEYDAYNQIEQFLGLQPMTAHWPPFSSAVMGVWVWLGKAVFGSYDIGVFLLVVFQTLVSTAALAYSITALRRLGTPLVWRVICLAIYALSTVYPNYITAVLKDTLYSISVLMFTVLLAENLMLECSWRKKTALGCVALLMCLLRNNGVYVLAVCLLVLGIRAMARREARLLPAIGAMAAALVLNICYSEILLPAMDIPSGSVAEALSIPFQQTARYVRDYPEDVTEEEAETIAAVLDYDNLAALYDPDLSDPVKGTYHGDSGDLAAYFKVWLRQFFRHPDAYFEATLNNIYGYITPFARNFIFYSGTWNLHELRFSEPEVLSVAKAGLRDYVALFESFPGLAQLTSCGFHFWLLLALLLYTWREGEKKRLFVLLPALVGAAVCIASPTYTINGVRYALPVIYSTPFLTGLCCFGGNDLTCGQ